MKENETAISQDSNELTISWPIDQDQNGVLVLNLEKEAALFSKIGIKENGVIKSLAENAEPVFTLNVGKRTLKPENGWTIFFDKVHERPYKSYLLDFEKKNVAIEKVGQRTTIRIDEVSAPDFKGPLEITIYNKSALFNIAAVVKTARDSTAILYDAGLTVKKPFEKIAFVNGEEQIEEIEGDVNESQNQKVKYRTIIGSGSNGSLAVLPAPHQYFYPLDEAFNLAFTWYGPNYRGMVENFGIGIRQPPNGDDRFVPWFNAPPNTDQRLNFFCYLDSGNPEALMSNVKKYTHNDTYKAVDGFKTMASHFHNEFIMNVVRTDKQVPKDPEFVNVFKDMGVNVVHLGEFHYTAHPKGPDSLRLQELKSLFDQCERLSDDDFLLLPGEEPNEFLGGHWMEFFPKPVYWIMSRDDDKPFVTEDTDYGKVYRIKDKEEMLKLLRLENGLAWTAHPRIKGSTGYPDAYKEENFFKSDRFLGGAWKAMPADLSTPKLGLRVLELLDDMNNWGLQKKVIAESDLFTINKDNEMYAHMNINYLQLDVLPAYSDNWNSVLQAMSAGKFFSTTGEILIPSFTVNGKSSGELLKLDASGKSTIDLDLDWTFPLNFIEVISGDGKEVFRKRIDMSQTTEFNSEKFQFEVSLKDKNWVRIEIWDIAANGAFTQTVYLQND